MASSTYQPMGKDKHKGQDQMDKAKEAGNEALQKTKDAGTEAMQTARDIGSNTLEKAKEAGSDAMQKAREAGSEVLGKAREAASAAGEMAGHATSAVGQKADDLTAAAGHQIREFADTIDRSGPHEGLIGAASHAVAEGVKGSGRYLEEAKLSGMAHDVETVVKNHPIPAMLVCLGVGICIGRVLKD